MGQGIIIDKKIMRFKDFSKIQCICCLVFFIPVTDLLNRASLQLCEININSTKIFSNIYLFIVNLKIIHEAHLFRLRHHFSGYVVQLFQMP